MSLPTVLYDVKENIVKITMNRPERMNALNKELWDELIAAFERAETDPDVKVIILTGSGKAFCSGWDLKSSYYLTPPEGEDRFTTASALVTMKRISNDYLKIMNVRKPTIAQVSGYCLAAGIYLEMLCDLAYAAEDAVFGHPVSGGPDSVPLFVWHMGTRKAKEFLMTHRFINGIEAERMDMINKAIPADQLEDYVWQMAKDMTQIATDGDVAHGQAIMKENINVDAEIMGLGALFSYHRHLNGLAHVGVRAPTGDQAARSDSP